MDCLTHVGSVPAYVQYAHQPPNSLCSGAYLQSRDLDARSGLQIASWTLTLCELPVAQKHDKVALLLSLLLDIALAIHSHHFIALVESRSVGELDRLGLKIQSSNGIIGEFPVDGFAHVHVVSTHLLHLSRSTESAHNGTRKSTRNQTEQYISKQLLIFERT